MSVFDMMNEFNQAIIDGGRMIEDDEIRAKEREKISNKKSDHLNDIFVDKTKTLTTIRFEQYQNTSYRMYIKLNTYNTENCLINKSTLDQLAYITNYFTETKQFIRKHMLMYISNKKIKGYTKIDFIYAHWGLKINHVFYSTNLNESGKLFASTFCDGEEKIIKLLNLKLNKIKSVWIKITDNDVSDYV